MPLRRGEIYRYYYLWAREHEQLEESGRKARPVCLVIRSPQSGHLFLFALTTQQPPENRVALEVPAEERRLAGLKVRCWIILDEYNRAPERALHDFQSIEPLGQFSDRFLKRLATIITNTRDRQTIKAVPRT